MENILLMYNLLEHSDNYSTTPRSFWNCYRDEINNDANENFNNKIYNKTITSKFFEYKTKLIESTPDDDNTLDAGVVVPLKYLSNFWRFLDLPLINCEIALYLSWSKECYNIWIAGNLDANPPAQEVAAI